MGSQRIKGYIKSNIGFLSQTDVNEWIPIYEFYKKSGSCRDTSSYFEIRLSTLTEYLFKVFKLPKLDKESMYSKRSDKFKKTCLKKYGVTHISQTDNFKKKIKETCLEKYGATTNLKTKEHRDLTKTICIEKYGDSNYNNRKKAEETCLDKYGDSNYNNRKKAEETCLEKYGVSNPNKLEYVRNKVKATCLKRYGTEYSLTNNSVREKIKLTCLDRYGVTSITKATDYINSVKNARWIKTLERRKSQLVIRGYELMEDFTGIKNTVDNEYLSWKKYKFKHLKCGHIFEDTFSNKIHCPECYKVNKIHSIQEKLLSEFITSLEIHHETRNRIILKGKELDIYIPRLNIAFEYNGTVWHSSKFKNNIEYHKNKTELSLSEGIKLYHIWEHDNEEIVKSMIKSKLGKIDNKYYARKLQIKEVDTSDRQKFFNDNHLHGDVKSKTAYGLYDKDELISCISFRGHKEGIEIARFATKLNSSCVGGFSKLLKHSIPKLKELGYSKIVTYCDRDWTPDYKDSTYFKNGFTFLGDTGCILNYYNKGKVQSRETFQKHKLKYIFPETYSDDKTANEILEENKIYAIHNSGNWKFELEM